MRNKRGKCRKAVFSSLEKKRGSQIYEAQSWRKSQKKNRKRNTNAEKKNPPLNQENPVHDGKGQPGATPEKKRGVKKKSLAAHQTSTFLTRGEAKGKGLVPRGKAKPNVASMKKRGRRAGPKSRSEGKRSQKESVMQ